jgi:hypothetical protein
LPRPSSSQVADEELLHEHRKGHTGWTPFTPERSQANDGGEAISFRIQLDEPDIDGLVRLKLPPHHKRNDPEALQSGGQGAHLFLGWLFWSVVHIYFLITVRDRFIVAFTWSSSAAHD